MLNRELEDHRVSRNRELKLQRMGMNLKADPWKDNKKDKELQREQNKSQLALIAELATQLNNLCLQLL